LWLWWWLLLFLLVLVVMMLVVVVVVIVVVVMLVVVACHCTSLCHFSLGVTTATALTILLCAGLLHGIG